MRFLVYTKKVGIWYADSILRFVIVALTVSAATTYAAISWNVSNAPQMYLYSSINGTQTTGIVIDAPQINGDDWTFPTTTGGVLRIRAGGYREDIYYASASVNATTYRVTLSGVTRDICPSVETTIVGCGNGRRWGKGAIVELIQDARLFNLKVNSDRINTVGTGFALRGSSTTYPLIRLNSVTTAQRNAMSAANGDLVYDSTTGAIMQYVGGAWGTVGTTTLVNASESAAGKVQLASTGSMSTRNVTGSTGAAEVVQTRYLTSTGGTTRKYQVPLLGRLGTLTGSILGTGVTGTGRFLGGDGKWATISTASIGGAGTRGNLLWSNGTNWTTTGSIIKPSFETKTDTTQYSITTTNQTTPISANLTTTLTVNAGALLLMNFNTMIEDSNATSTVVIDFLAGGGRVSMRDGGAAGRGLYKHTVLTDTTFQGVNITYLHRVQTGGTLTFTPVAYVDANGVQIGSDSHFSVTKLTDGY